MASGRTELSVVVPFYDEMHRLDATLPAIVALATDDTEVILVDDGSTDGTGAALDAAATARGVRVVHLLRNQGKGAAVRAGIGASMGRIVMYMDADLATDLADVPRLTAALAGADVAVGSRAAAAADVRDASWARTHMGIMFNRAVRLATGLELLDTQCGFKAFRGELGRTLFAHTHVDGFAFDVEVLMLAREIGARMIEVPVEWTEQPGSKVRLTKDPLLMLFDLVRIRRRVRATARAVAPGHSLASVSLNEIS